MMMYLRGLLTFKTRLSRKPFICIALPLLVVWRFGLQTISDRIVKYAIVDHPFMRALAHHENVAVYDEHGLLSEYLLILIALIALLLGVCYATLCVMIGRLRSQGWPLWVSVPMLAADMLIFPYIWIPFCLFPEKK